MKFKLFEKLAKLEGLELIMLIAAAAIFIGLLVGVIVYYKKEKPAVEAGKSVSKTRKLVYGAMFVTLSFVLSYFKLFSMPFGGSITLVSMLPIMFYAYMFGPSYGFLAAFAYALLQVVQGAYIVHPVQFILDYFIAFTCLGIPSLFPKKLTLGVAAGGFSRMFVSIISGAIFFADSGFDYGIANPWVYSMLYNLLTIGVDTVLCMIVSVVPAFRNLEKILK